MINLLSTLLTEQKENFSRIKNSILRTAKFPKLPNKIKVAIGMRRVGKTFFMLQEMQKIMDTEQVPWERFLYLNFEDDRILPCSQEKFRDLLEAFYKIYPENHDNLCFLFLDEVQNVEDWSKVIRRFFDTKKVQIYLSGSSAKLLSKEIATELRGRSIATEIWPYSFKEYMIVKNVKLDEQLLGQKNKDILFKLLQEYIDEGGFPETVSFAPVEKRRQILQDYVELVILRDIVERYEIKNIAVIKYMIKTLVKNAGCSFSVNKMYNDLKSQGLSASRHLLYDYLSYIEDAYLIFTVSLFSESLRQTQSNPRKSYAIDTGLVKAFSFSLNKNNGHLFENLVFLDLKRQEHKIYYYMTRNKYEIDFLTEDLNGNRKLYQVVWNVEDKETLARELRALEEAQIELNLPGELITPETYLQKIWNELTT